MDLSSSARSSTGQSTHPDIALITQTHSNRLNKVEEILQNNPSLQIMTIKDIRLYSLLHIGCLNNQISICKVFFNYLNEQHTPAEEITEWVNSKTDEGFAAIHFASFKGSVELIKLLESYGADINAKNNRGLNVLHIAAQGDQPVSIAYFMRSGLNLHEKDANGSTPLHWAGYFGMENSTYFLTSWGCNPNERDQEFGCTPLHLAVTSGNIRVVRRLLLKGADKNIKNDEGKNALEVAKENEYESIVELLQPRSFFVAFFNIRPELTNKRTKSSLLLFIFLYTLIAALNVIFVFPFISTDLWVILFSAFLGLTLLFFLAVWFKSPGYMSNKRNGDVLGLLMSNRSTPHLVCPDCIIVKPDRSKHCEICNTCVAVYDHHCPWVNNCIGANNYRYFILFIMMCLASMVFLLVFGIIHIQATETTDKYVKIHINLDLLTKLKDAVCAINFAILLIFMVPLVGLNYLHMGNLIKGKTTVERYGYKTTTETMTMSQLAIDSPENEYLRMKESKAKQKNTGVLGNCISMCCGNAYNPKYKYKYP